MADSKKHTTGPWLKAGRSAGVHIHANNGEVAWLRSYMGIADEEINANAHLIAAAPDLLEALKQCRDAMHADNPADGWLEIITFAEAAIASAEGRS